METARRWGWLMVTRMEKHWDFLMGMPKWMLTDCHLETVKLTEMGLLMVTGSRSGSLTGLR